MHVGAIRKKLGVRRTYVETVRGVGYRLKGYRSTSDPEPRKRGTAR